MSVGFIFMIFLEDMELLIWGAWPCIAIGGMCGHMANAKMMLATPSFKGTFLAFLGGTLGAGGAVGLIMKGIMDLYNLQLADVFLYWLILYLGLAIIKIIAWTPIHMPDVILSDDEYSLWQNSRLLTLCNRKYHLKIQLF